MGGIGGQLPGASQSLTPRASSARATGHQIDGDELTRLPLIYQQVHLMPAFISAVAVQPEGRSSDAERARAATISATRSSSPRPSPWPTGRRRADPRAVSDRLGPGYRK